MGEVIGRGYRELIRLRLLEVIGHYYSLQQVLHVSINFGVA